MAGLSKYIHRGPAKNGRSKVSINKLEILFTIVSRSKADFYTDYIQSFGVNMQMVIFGQGTAPQEIATAMGLMDSDRAIIVSVIGEEHLREALDGLDEKFNTIIGGQGIAYTVPMSSIIGKSIFVMILVDTKIKDDVLHALYQKVGLDTMGQGIAFSLPVDNVVGLTPWKERLTQKMASVEKSGEKKTAN